MSAGARGLVAGPGALRALRAGRSGTVELAFRRAAYVRLGAGHLLVAERGARFGPLSLVVDAAPEVRAGSPARLEDERLVIDGFALSLERLRERRPPS